MINFFEIFEKSFRSYKKDVFSIFLFGLADIFVFTLTLIPIIGIFIGAYLLPRILGWYYNKTIGNIKPNYDLVFKVWLLFILLHHLLVILFFDFSILIKIFNLIIEIFNINNLLSFVYSISNTIIFLIFPLFFIWLVFFYPTYALILGKIDEFKLYPFKSFILLIYTTIWNIISILIIFMLINLPIVGTILAILFILFVYQQIFNLIIANTILSM